MAIKVSGTTVVDDSRNLTNIASVDATTVTAIGAAGVGGGGTHDFVASGAIANGDIVILNSDGTVTVAGNVTIPQSIGSRTQYEAAFTERNSVVYDPVNDKVVIAYRDNGNSNYGTAIVGTVSGNSITFGTPVVFVSDTCNNTSITYDPYTQKIILVWQKNTVGESAVGTVSGNSISFGTTVSFGTNATSPQVTSDPNTDKFLVAFRDGTDPYGSGKIIVGTVSGTSITYGGEESIVQNTQSPPRQFLFDTNAGKAVILYVDNTNTALKAKVVSYSGTTPSLGSETSIATTSYHRSLYDSTNNKIITFFRDNNNSNYGSAKIGTVSGTSITYGSATVFNTAQSDSITVAYGSQGAKSVVFYKDATDSTYKIIEATSDGSSLTFNTAANVETDNPGFPFAAYNSGDDKVVLAYSVWPSDGFARVIQYTSSESNITNSNVIGVAAEAISDTATGEITIIGGVNDGQTGLTTNQSYFVADDGTLTTTNNGRKIGEALSASELQVKTKLTGSEMNEYLGGLV